MKRLFVLFAFLLVSGAAFAQEEKPQSEGTLMIVPRLEAEPTYDFDEKAWTFKNGTFASLWTVFDGNLGEHFSFSISNHWFTFDNSFQDAKDLYKHTWRCDENNWVDWANVTAHFGNFSLTLGKDYIHFGTFEIDDYDYDAHWQMNSMLWNYYQVYQWGGSFGWTSNDESTSVLLQMTTDQTMEKPFSSKNLGDYAYTLFGKHETDEVSLMGSISHCSLGWIGALGAELTLSDALTLRTDGYISDTYCSASARLTAALGQKADLFVKGGFDVGSNELILDGRGINIGLGGYWYPLRDNRDLRIHALCDYDSIGDNLYLAAGITYALNLKIF